MQTINSQIMSECQNDVIAIYKFVSFIYITHMLLISQHEV